MSLAGIGAIAGGLSGLAGLFGIGAPRKSAAQRQAEEQAARTAALQNSGFTQALELAQKYDPVAEAQGTVQLAEQQAGKTLSDSLRALNARFKASGGNAGQDTFFNANSQAIARDTMNPLKSLLAEAQGNATQKKMAAILSAVGAGGSVMGSYLNVANAGQQAPRDLSGSLALLSQSLGQLPFFKSGQSDSNGTTAPGAKTKGKETLTR
ncbi:MAG: hypothetical protein WCZ86_06050 [Desulfurivibrionaceae bacterium]